jgi:hypothetical protein
MNQDLASMLIRADCESNEECVTHTDKIEGNLPKCPSVMGICRESYKYKYEGFNLLGRENNKHQLVS